MSGLVGYVGDKPCKQIIHEGLAQLEFHEHDSAGFVCIDKAHNHFSFRKETSGTTPIAHLFEGVQFDGAIGMGHIRWATRGGVDQRNAHPHFNCRNLREPPFWNSCEGAHGGTRIQDDEH